MDNKFSLKEIWMMFWGFGYLVNHRSREIHRIKDKRSNCKIQYMSKNNSEYVTLTKAKQLIETYRYNGCRWCWKIQDKG